MNKILKKFLVWLVISSKNPENVSLTVKSFLLGLIPAIIFITNMSHINLGSGELTQVVDTIVNMIQAFLSIVAGIAFVYGFLRKIYLTIAGKLPYTTGK